MGTESALMEAHEMKYGQICLFSLFSRPKKAKKNICTFRQIEWELKRKSVYYSKGKSYSEKMILYVIYMICIVIVAMKMKKG